VRTRERSESLEPLWARTTTKACEFLLFIEKKNMWENVPDFLELFRNFPVSLSVLFVVPVVLLSGPSSPVMAAHEFPVFRMQQFDLHQTQSGELFTIE